MLGRGYDNGISGWDEPPMPRPDWALASDERFDRAAERARQNAPAPVLLELGLVLAVPLAIAVTVTLILNAVGISTGI